MDKIERLTKRDEFGNADIIGVDSQDLQCNLEFDGLNKVTDALNRLAYYEELEEQGLLVKLPCKVGDMVRGEWLFRCIAGEAPYLCSLCGNTVDVYGYGYCPNCGAYMEGEDNG